MCGGLPNPDTPLASPTPGSTHASPIIPARFTSMVISTDQSRDPRLNLHTAGAMFTQLEDVQ